MARATLTRNQRALYEFLRQNPGRTVSLEELLKVTGWAEETWKVYWRKGKYNSYFRKTNGQYVIRNLSGVSELQFYQQATQANQNRSVAARCDSPLARALVKRARDNFILALEIFNRPSVTNRAEAFAMLICSAWEQLLKAKIIERESAEDVIFLDRRTRYGRRQTISMSRTLGSCFKENDPVYLNLLRIVDLRDGATHLLMPEAQGTVSFLFQSCVLNFIEHFENFTGAKPLPSDRAGLLSLICELRAVSRVALQDTYGDLVGNEIALMISDLETAVQDIGTEKFAFSLETRTVLTRDPKDADLVLSSGEASTTGLLIEVPQDVEKQYPMKYAEVVQEVLRRTKDVAFNRYSLQAVLWKERISGHPYSHQNKLFGRTTYSEKLVDLIVEKLVTDDGYHDRVRQSYSGHQRKQRMIAG